MRLYRIIKSTVAIFAVSAIVMMLAGCGRRPSNVLSEKKMVDLMVDLKLGDAYANVQFNGGSYQERRTALAEGILASHKISREELDSTLSWYGRNLDDYTILCEKVEKKLEQRRKDMLHVDVAEELNQNALWPYPQNGTISTLGTSDGLIVSIPNPDVERGDILKWKLHSTSAPQLLGVFGVEYTNGTSDAVTMSYYDNSIEMELQTDSGKTVKRIYGTLRVKEPLRSTIYLDSIMMTRTPYDSVEYQRYRNMKRYGVGGRKAVKKDDDNADNADESADVKEKKSNTDAEGNLLHRFENADNFRETPPQGAKVVGKPNKARSLEKAREETSLKNTPKPITQPLKRERKAK